MCFYYRTPPSLLAPVTALFPSRLFSLPQISGPGTDFLPLASRYLPGVQEASGQQAKKTRDGMAVLSDVSPWLPGVPSLGRGIPFCRTKSEAQGTWVGRENEPSSRCAVSRTFAAQRTESRREERAPQSPCEEECLPGEAVVASGTGLFPGPRHSSHGTRCPLASMLESR